MIPFAHKDLEVKVALILKARSFFNEMNNDEGSLEKELAAALLYMNVADYIAEYILLSLIEMSKIAIDKFYLGIVTITPPKEDGKFNLDSSMRRLKFYDFPQKNAMMTELGKIKKARNEIAHTMLKIDANDLVKIDEAVRVLQEHTEKLIDIADSINLGMPPQTLLDKIQQNNNNKDELNDKPKPKVKPVK